MSFKSKKLAGLLSHSAVLVTPGLQGVVGYISMFISHLTADVHHFDDTLEMITQVLVTTWGCHPLPCHQRIQEN